MAGKIDVYVLVSSNNSTIDVSGTRHTHASMAPIPTRAYDCGAAIANEISASRAGDGEIIEIIVDISPFPPPPPPTKASERKGAANSVRLVPNAVPTQAPIRMAGAKSPPTCPLSFARADVKILRAAKPRRRDGGYANAWADNGTPAARTRFTLVQPGGLGLGLGVRVRVRVRG